MFVARDRSGAVSLYLSKPVRDDNFDMWVPDDVSSSDFIEIDSSLFPDLTWEDEPSEVRLTEINPVLKKKCHKCGEEIKYHYSDVKTYYDCQPWSGYEEEWHYITCPHCGEKCVKI